MVIVLTKDEKRTFFGFLGLYLGSSLLLIIVIGYFFYGIQMKHYNELALSKVENNANMITRQIIQSQMQNMTLSLENMKIEKGFKYGLYNDKQKPIYTQIQEPIDFAKKFYREKNNIFYVDNGAVGHQGVYYVVVKDSDFNISVSNLLNDVIVGILVLYIIIALIGFFLAKIFIHPIQTQREKLNNFIKDTTHELNTPLSAILLCVDAKNFFSEENRENIKISAKKISNIYKNLTYLFLKEHQESLIHDANVAEILQSELPYHEQLAKKKNIKITSSIDPTFFAINEEDFSRLTSNLILNAIKYTRRNGTITITLKDKILMIEDNGIGIEKSQQDKIFERYYRATPNEGGFGLGLNIVYTICQKYKIKINFNSEIKKGTTFTLDFNA